MLAAMQMWLTLGQFEGVWDLMRRGGVVMWPLLGLSVLGVTLLVERAWFCLSNNGPGRLRRVEALTRKLRAGDRAAAATLAEADPTVYGDTGRRLLGEPVTPAAAVDAIEAQRPRLERFLPTLSTIITAAPMLGILGTVLGIIASFEVLGGVPGSAPASAPGSGGGGGPSDPALVGRGIAEALITTAAGLVVALGVLLPYNLLRVQVDRTLSRLEQLAAAAEQGLGEEGDATNRGAERGQAAGDE